MNPKIIALVVMLFTTVNTILIFSSVSSIDDRHAGKRTGVPGRRAGGGTRAEAGLDLTLSNNKPKPKPRSEGTGSRLSCEIDKDVYRER